MMNLVFTEPLDGSLFVVDFALELSRFLLIGVSIVQLLLKRIVRLCTHIANIKL